MVKGTDRTTITLSPKQKETLEKIAFASRNTKNTVIRDAIGILACYIRSQRDGYEVELVRRSLSDPNDQTKIDILRLSGYDGLKI